MSDTTIPPVTTPAEAPRARSYFNKAQIEDLALAESISTATASYLVELDDQDVSKDKELARLGRDELLHVLNTRRSSIQHAADAIWPWNDEAHRPIRKIFALPLTRPMGM